MNAYDAGAKECRISVPDINVSSREPYSNFVAIFDDGIGMDADGLSNLWQIGRSFKKTEEVSRRFIRKQIGRFGIGKLATYTIANRLTYISKSHGKTLAMSVDFSEFLPSESGSVRPVELPVREIVDWQKFKITIQTQLDACGVGSEIEDAESWTLAVLEDLKPVKLKRLKYGTLEWVLRTAMPLGIDFNLFLNSNKIESSKEDYKKVVEFKISDLPKKRLENLQEATKVDWTIVDQGLKSEFFPSGIFGTIFVTERTLIGNKSEDIARSHGFFIRVNKRLVNLSDPLFIDQALMHGVFNRFRADIDVDDLNTEIKASRESFEESQLKDILKIVLREIFNEASGRYNEFLAKSASDGKKMEGKKELIAPQLVEIPLADTIAEQSDISGQTDADGNWFYVGIKPEMVKDELVKTLYSSRTQGYKYRYTASGATERIVKLDPIDRTFWINSDHELVKEYAEGATKLFLEDFVTAETMLEIYLKEAKIGTHIIGTLLERRDQLLRSLVKDHAFSSKNIAQSLREAGSDERELEVLLVVAMRALGFVAKHISNAGEPDGVARFNDIPNGERKITLEAKSSIGTPQLSALDFAGLREHMVREGAQGCLLLAPSFPGATKQDSAVDVRASQQNISCWHVETLAKFIDAADSHHLNARDLLNIVLKVYEPDEVDNAVNNLISSERRDKTALYTAIIRSLKSMESRMTDSPRNSSMITTSISFQSGFEDIKQSEVDNALRELSNASQGYMIYTKENIIILNVSVDELEARLHNMTKGDVTPRRISNFREKEN
ncbi:Histidine kinase-, DNA gyrase B-, and HSP90-like ATPase [Deinococcus reticulitermitis]|uniref:Histidine kinase-, DNA gyrase B-, and HSP90-like ATPase n=1 Tax=Deinococcus reticulitermitis TaxID=856736 RepID=A0A1H6UG05_9DEIO|nr:Histidine kinase-, DNA gyrase B-, and HSP90-like ATPase [Deinococcus reticulitermitis]